MEKLFVHRCLYQTNTLACTGFGVARVHQKREGGDAKNVGPHFAEPRDRRGKSETQNPQLCTLVAQRPPMGNDHRINWKTAP